MKNQETKNIFLTFDDGPSNPWTPQILDILKDFQIKATFFVCGKNIERYPKIAKRIVNEGHAIGNHSYYHSKIRSSTPLLLKDVEKTSEVILKITSTRSKIFRPPWGIVTPWLKRYLLKNGLKLILWDIEAHDWKQPQAKIISQRILSKAKSNSIILLHDGDGIKKNCNRFQTVFSLPLIIKELKDKGFIFEKIC